MDFDSPDVMKDFPGLYASELNKQCNNDSDYSDENERVLKKDLIGKRKDKKDKDKGYAALEGESSADEQIKSRSPSKSKKTKSFKFTTKTKEKRDKSREKDKDFERKKEREKKNDKKVDKDKSKPDKTKKIKQFLDETNDIGDVLPIFGAILEDSVERSRCHDGVDIPLPIRECIDFIETMGINFEGLYKVSGTKSKVLHIKKLYNQRGIINLSDYDVPTVTSLLKTYLRDLPEPLFTNDQIVRFEEAGAILNLNTREKHLKILIDNLPSHNKLLLGWLIVHLCNVSTNEKSNKMNKQSLSAALNHTFHCSSRLLHALLHHSPSLFPNITTEKYVPPLESGARLPQAPAEIAHELKKQESLLTQIHKEMNMGCISREREELLWEVQRIITQLKRNLKSANKDKEEKQPVEPPKEEKEESKPAETVSNNIAPQEEPVQKEEKMFVPDRIVLELLQSKNFGLKELKDSLVKQIQAEQEEISDLRKQVSADLPSAVMVANDNLDEVMDLFLKENQILQIKKINLVRQIIEEQEMCIELNAQIIAGSV